MPSRPQTPHLVKSVRKYGTPKGRRAGGPSHGLEPEEESYAMPVQECAETPRAGVFTHHCVSHG